MENDVDIGGIRPWCCFSMFGTDASSVKKAKKGDKLRVVKTINRCCCMEDAEVLVIGVSWRGDLTIQCPVWGQHELGFAYNPNFRFIEESTDV